MKKRFSSKNGPLILAVLWFSGGFVKADAQKGADIFSVLESVGVTEKKVVGWFDDVQKVDKDDSGVFHIKLNPGDSLVLEGKNLLTDSDLSGSKLRIHSIMPQIGSSISFRVFNGEPGSVAGPGENFKLIFYRDQNSVFSDYSFIALYANADTGEPYPHYQKVKLFCEVKGLPSVSSSEISASIPSLPKESVFRVDDENIEVIMVRKVPEELKVSVSKVQSGAGQNVFVVKADPENKIKGAVRFVYNRRNQGDQGSESSKAVSIDVLP